MRSALIRILLMVVVLDCATAGRIFPWPVPRDFWRVCSILGIGCAADMLTGRGRCKCIEPPDGRVALAVAAGFLVRGAIKVLVCLNR
jgi:hypothetical protein